MNLERKINPVALLIFLLPVCFFTMCFSLMIYAIIVSDPHNRPVPLWTSILLCLALGYIMFCVLIWEPYKTFRYKNRFIYQEHQFSYRDITKAVDQIEDGFVKEFGLNRAFIKYKGMKKDGAHFSASFNALDTTKIPIMQKFLSERLEKDINENIGCPIAKLTFVVSYYEAYLYH